MEKRNFAFTRINFILIAIGLVIIVTGLLLMAGPGSTEESFNADIFSPMRIKVAPIVTFVGFVSIIFAILYHKKEDKEETK